MSKEKECKDTKKKAAEVPKEGIELLNLAIEMAKAEKACAKKRRQKKLIQMAVTSFIFVFVAIPNINVETADAVSELPFLGSVFRAVTFREYHYNGERFNADVNIPEVIVEPEIARGGVADLNERIKETVEPLLAEFKKELEEKTEVGSLQVDYEVIRTTKEYFTLKLMIYQGGADGYETDYFYTIDVNSGHEMKLRDLFAENTDYITPISENIKSQMREQMEDERYDVIYWIDLDKADPIYESRFEAIDDEQSFYINQDGSLVIAFSEGEVAPMYMDTIEFTIPKEITNRIK